MAFSTAPIAAGSLVSGYMTARFSGKRQLGGLVLAAGGAAAASQWRKQGNLTAGALLAVYLGGFGASHPLAKRIGAWPSVFTVAGLSGAASYLVYDRGHVAASAGAV